VKNAVKLFLEIVKTVSNGRLQLQPQSKIGELFQDAEAFGPLQYEMCLYCLGATLKRGIDQSFYEGGVEKDFDDTISDFVAKYLRDDVSRDPLFVTRQFMEYAKSARWEHDENAKPGRN
jgi:hypothetical protein